MPQTRAEEPKLQRCHKGTQAPSMPEGKPKAPKAKGRRDQRSGIPRRNSNSKHAHRQAKGKRERALKEPRLGSQLEGKGLKAKGAGTQGTRVEEPGARPHRSFSQKK